METIAITNLGAGPLAANYFSTIASGATKTLTLKSIDSDDQYVGYNRAAAVGAYISINGTLATGAQATTTTATLAAATRVARGDTTGGAYTITLMPLAGFPTDSILYVNFAVRGSTNNLTLDGNAAETIDGAATKVLSAAGITRLKKTGATTWVSF